MPAPFPIPSAPPRFAALDRDFLLSLEVKTPRPGQELTPLYLRRPYAAEATCVMVDTAELEAACRADARHRPHDKLLVQVKRHNAMVRNSEQMFAVVKRFKDLCHAGVIASKTTQAECDRIIAAVEGGAS
jgi:hypothetical protein